MIPSCKSGATGTAIPVDARSVTIEVVFADGTTSQRRFSTSPTL
jgi:hypothetical protein